MGGSNAHFGGDYDGAAVEARCERVLLRGFRGGAVLGPEVDLISGVERGLVGGTLGAATAGAAATAGRLRAAGAGRVSIEINTGEQRRACDLAGRVRLNDARDRGRDVEIRSLRFLHQVGELLRTEVAPPIE